MFVITPSSTNQIRIIANAVFRSYSSGKLPQFENLAVTEPKKHVFHVSLNRPAKLNSFSHKMWLELTECFRSLSDNPECRAVLLSGEGKHFTAGIDLNSFIEKSAEAADLDDVARKSRFLEKMIKTYQDSMSSVEECVKPVLVVAHSACVGAGVDLITAADIRFSPTSARETRRRARLRARRRASLRARWRARLRARRCARRRARRRTWWRTCGANTVRMATTRKLIIRYCTEDAWFTIKEVDIGLAADVGTLQRLPKVIGSTSIARELALTARKFDAKEALQIGLVSRVYPDKDTAIEKVLEIASSIAAKSPVAVQATKQNMVYSQSRTVEEGLMHIRLLNQIYLQSEDLSKCAIAAATKSTEPPEFENL